MNSQSFSPPLPKEHGAWAVLYAPIALVLLVLFRVELTLVPTLVAVTGLFLAHEPATRIVRGLKYGVSRKKLAGWLGWLTVYTVPALLSGLVLLLYFRLWLFLPFAVAIGLFYGARLYLARERRERSTGAELLGILGLSATSPAVYYALTARIDAMGVILWVSSTLFFLSGVLYVKMRIGRLLKPVEFPRARFQCLLYHLSLLPAIVVFMATDWLPPLSALAFLPIVIRALVSAFRVDEHLNIQRIGYLEVGHTVLFVLLFSAGWHL